MWIACFSVFLSGCSSTTRPDGSTTMIYGTCGKDPKYSAAIPIHRFARFPVTVSVNVSSAVISSPAWLANYRDALALGAGAWAEVMTGGVGQVTVSRDNPAALIQMTLETVSADSVAGTENHRGSDLVTSAAISIYRYWNADLDQSAIFGSPGTYEPPVDRGTLPLATWKGYLAGIAAHEMGHAFFAGGHPPVDDTLMSSPNATYVVMGPRPDYQSYFSVSDRNTMNEAYCR